MTATATATRRDCGICRHFGCPRDGRVVYIGYCRMFFKKRFAYQTCPRWEARYGARTA